VTWQRWTLSSPVNVTANTVYSFLVTPASASGPEYRVGLMVVDAYRRGENHFQAPGYDFAFQTRMLEPPPGYQAPTAAPAVNPFSAVRALATFILGRAALCKYRENDCFVRNYIVTHYSLPCVP
jgi:hypothetical protein